MHSYTGKHALISMNTYVRNPYIHIYIYTFIHTYLQLVSLVSLVSLAFSLTTLAVTGTEVRAGTSHARSSPTLPHC